MSWKAVIPSDSADNLAKSVGLLLKAHEGLSLSRIIVVSRHLKEAPKGFEGLILVQDPVEAFNFARRANLGFAYAEEDDVVLMGDDVEVVTPGAFDLLAEEAPLRILSASIKGRVGPWWQKDGLSHPEVPFVSFIAVYLPRFVRRMTGTLDERLPGYGYEDTDYCFRARRKGLSIGVSGKAVVEHSVGIPSAFVEAYGAQLPSMEHAARKAFERKYADWEGR